MSDSIIDLLFSPVQAAAAGMRWLRSVRDRGPEIGSCVVCGTDTWHQIVCDGQFIFTHTQDDDNYLGCKDICLYRESIRGLVTREEWLRKNITKVQLGILDERDYDFLDDRDTHSDYRSYILSREWQIKADRLKCLANWTCERCGRGGNNKTLHAHHRHYETLYYETRDDLECLCASCHQAHHESLRNRRGK